MRVPFSRVMVKKSTAEVTEHVDIAGVSPTIIQHILCNNNTVYM